VQSPILVTVGAFVYKCIQLHCPLCAIHAERTVLQDTRQIRGRALNGLTMPRRPVSPRERRVHVDLCQRL